MENLNNISQAHVYLRELAYGQTDSQAARQTHRWWDEPQSETIFNYLGKYKKINIYLKYTIKTEWSFHL